MVRTLKRMVRRPGFTLIELLVVIAIIALLMSMTAVAVFRLIGTTQGNNTKSELARIEGALKKVWRESADQFSTEPIPATGNYNAVYSQIVLPMAGGKGHELRAKVIWTKLRLKQAFPNNFNEALNPAPLPALPYYATKLGGLGYTIGNTSAANPQSFESSACLLLALQRGSDGPGLKKEDIGGSTFFQEFPTFDDVKQSPLNNGQTVTAMIDGWQKPLVFVRWPVFLAAPNYKLTGAPLPNPPGPAFNDADDPTGELASATWQSNAVSLNWFTTNCHPLAAHAAGKEPTTFKLFPIIASSGANGQLGFNPNTIQTAAGQVDGDDLLATLNP
jgi:prepilin-type N-terminal cleavage/methylation domain-containing protein